MNILRYRNYWAADFAADGHWLGRHNDALLQPEVGYESAIVAMLDGLVMYYAASRDEDSGSTVMQDGVLREYYRDIARGVLGLLNGETGRFDCGTLCARIRKLADLTA